MSGPSHGMAHWENGHRILGAITQLTLHIELFFSASHELEINLQYTLVIQTLNNRKVLLRLMILL